MLIYHGPDNFMFHNLVSFSGVHSQRDVPIKNIVCFILPIQSSQRQSEQWCIKNMLQTSTAQLFLYMLAMKTNNIDT